MVVLLSMAWRPDLLSKAIPRTWSPSTMAVLAQEWR